ncbi:MAG: acetylglutamate kinase [Candidatus Dadabacteria bacterium]|nr:acetylglutamate kinase [Candidatus Dadabacteria bacterium]
MDELIQKAQTLIEALPYIREFYGKTIVVKYGGSIGGEELFNFASDIVLMRYVGMNPVVVHGGGPQIGNFMSRLGIESEFIAGLRVTDELTMEITLMVLIGKVNTEIVTAINTHGSRAVGISGNAATTIMAKKIDISKVVSDKKDLPKDADLGMVGEVEKISPELINTLQASGFIPVIAPIGFDEGGKSYNINADHVAGKIAGALQAEKLVLLTDVAGITDGGNKLISSLSKRTAMELIDSGVISSGMIPKVGCALDALQYGVRKVHIIDGRVERALILEIFTDSGIGTEIVL